MGKINSCLCHKTLLAKMGGFCSNLYENIYCEMKHLL